MSFMLYALRSRKRKQMEQHQMEEMRISFFTNITHEFRTPLTVILGYSRMMEEGKVPAGDMAKVGSMVSRQGTRLLSLINQFARHTEGEVEYRTSRLASWRHRALHGKHHRESSQYGTLQTDNPDVCPKAKEDDV
ncbi:histidine kinase dimerization/phospho-acceptor domain-containing protein [Prevotella sp. LMAG:51]|uniref:histidine kinase dimerization/phospho-acceptor domain-containing protein n=1 Tax=Prevotella sp. LMAG:51 TaxID=1969564 RepID=UPI00338EEEE7